MQVEVDHPPLWSYILLIADQDLIARDASFVEFHSLDELSFTQSASGPEPFATKDFEHLPHQYCFNRCWSKYPYHRRPLWFFLLHQDIHRYQPHWNPRWRWPLVVGVLLFLSYYIFRLQPVHTRWVLMCYYSLQLGWNPFKTICGMTWWLVVSPGYSLGGWVISCWTFLLSVRKRSMLFLLWWYFPWFWYICPWCRLHSESCQARGRFLFVSAYCVCHLRCCWWCWKLFLCCWCGWCCHHCYIHACCRSSNATLYQSFHQWRMIPCGKASVYWVCGSLRIWLLILVGMLHCWCSLCVCCTMMMVEVAELN